MNEYQVERAIRDALAHDRLVRRVERDESIHAVSAILRTLLVIGAVVAGFIYEPAATVVVLGAIIALNILWRLSRGIYRAVDRGVRSWTTLSPEARGARLYGHLRGLGTHLRRMGKLALALATLLSVCVAGGALGGNAGAGVGLLTGLALIGWLFRARPAA